MKQFHIHFRECTRVNAVLALAPTLRKFLPAGGSPGIRKRLADSRATRINMAIMETGKSMTIPVRPEANCITRASLPAWMQRA